MTGSTFELTQIPRQTEDSMYTHI